MRNYSLYVFRWKRIEQPGGGSLIDWQIEYAGLDGEPAPRHRPPRSLAHGVDCPDLHTARVEARAAMDAAEDQRQMRETQSGAERGDHTVRELNAPRRRKKK